MSMITPPSPSHAEAVGRGADEMKRPAGAGAYAREAAERREPDVRPEGGRPDQDQGG